MSRPIDGTMVTAMVDTTVSTDMASTAPFSIAIIPTAGASRISAITLLAFVGMRLGTLGVDKTSRLVLAEWVDIGAAPRC